MTNLLGYRYINRYVTEPLTAKIICSELPYRSFLVMFSKHCGNCTKAISWLFSSSMKKQSASRTDDELFEHISQSTFRIISPLLIFEDTLIYILEENKEISLPVGLVAQESSACLVMQEIEILHGYSFGIM